MLRDAAIAGLIALFLLEVVVEMMGMCGVALPSRYPMQRTPNAEFVFAGQPFTFPEFTTPVKLNSQAFHDRERSAVPPPGVMRAGLWGDSLFEGYQVERDDLATLQMERRLVESGLPVEVMNLAYSGGRAATLQSEIALDAIQDLGVSLLLVEIHSVMELAHAKSGGEPSFLPPAFTGFPESRFGWIRRAMVEDLGLDGLFLVQDRARAIWGHSGAAESPDFYHRVHAADAPGREKAWETFRGLLEHLRGLEGARGIQVLLVYAPSWAEVLAERQGTGVSLSPSRIPLDHGGMQRRMMELATAVGLPMVDISPAFSDPGGKTHYASDRHWTPLGHVRVAAVIAPALEAMVKDSPRR